VTTISNNTKRQSTATASKIQAITDGPEHMIPAAEPAHHVRVHQTEEFQGVQSISPLPPAQELAELEKLTPGVTNRLLCMIEKEQEHRHSCDLKDQSLVAAELKRDSLTVRRGQKYALGVSIAMLCAATIVGVWGHPWAGTFIAGMNITALATSFIYGTKKLREHQEQKKHSELSSPSDEM